MKIPGMYLILHLNVQSWAKSPKIATNRQKCPKFIFGGNFVSTIINFYKNTVPNQNMIYWKTKFFIETITEAACFACPKYSSKSASRFWWLWSKLILIYYIVIKICNNIYIIPFRISSNNLCRVISLEHVAQENRLKLKAFDKIFSSKVGFEFISSWSSLTLIGHPIISIINIIVKYSIIINIIFIILNKQYFWGRKLL